MTKFWISILIRSTTSLTVFSPRYWNETNKDIWTFAGREQCKGEKCNYTSILVHHPTRRDNIDKDCVRGNAVSIFRKDVEGTHMGAMKVHEMVIFSSEFLLLVSY